MSFCLFRRGIDSHSVDNCDEKIRDIPIEEAVKLFYKYCSCICRHEFIHLNSTKYSHES